MSAPDRVTGAEDPRVHPDAPRILVVDDEAMIREILADFLTMEGFWVRTAEDGSAALVELSKKHYDLVLSDLKMPNMGGLELLEAISEHTPGVVTVIMTGFGTVETAIDAMKRGAYDYVLKPFKVEEVVHTIRRGLEKSKLQAENLRLREALSLYKVSEAIAASLSLEEVIAAVTDAALTEVRGDQVVILLDDGAGGLFERINEVALDMPDGRTARVVSPKAVATWFEQGQPLRVHGEDAAPFFEDADDGALDVHSLVATTLRMRARVLGYLCVVSYSKRKRFDEGQRKLLTIVANRAAAAVENAKLYEDLKATFHQTITGLASAIDKMDRYTAGHSERVAAYAQVLAIKLGLDEAEVEMVRQAALLHDVGKIGCVINLNKPGKLSQAEYEVFQLHPGYGKDIIEPITFLHPLIPGVHLHHERWDGQGYPLGLKGEDTPLIARIISVADTYDAMTSDRAYRKALPKDVASNEVRRCAGSQFDPEIANPFVDWVEEQPSSDPGPQSGV